MQYVGHKSSKRGNLLQLMATEQANGTVLPAWHPATTKVRAIGEKVVQSALQGQGGGYQEHMKACFKFSALAALYAVGALPKKLQVMHLNLCAASQEVPEDSLGRDGIPLVDI